MSYSLTRDTKSDEEYCTTKRLIKLEEAAASIAFEHMKRETWREKLAAKAIKETQLGQLSRVLLSWKKNSELVLFTCAAEACLELKQIEASLILPCFIQTPPSTFTPSSPLHTNTLTTPLIWELQATGFLWNLAPSSGIQSLGSPRTKELSISSHSAI
ncbi:hypothetical protein LR48_Vigan08g087200 [Vigna angularis]|uniref:Uncharacterized protein n=1 Tax=Phaseolus angularis TaxID=3914 RepID=A0A0L9V4Q0_PHAAN|nr:hypothetical protein LR48_Vigan08g087200 [Vigna angularis]